MKIETDPQPILARPLKRLERIRPRNLGQERLPFPSVNRPVWNRQTDPIQSRACDLCKVLFGLVVRD